MKGSLPILCVVLMIGTAGCSDDDATDAGDVTPPANTTDLIAATATDTSITLTWTAPGDDGTRGTAAQYDVRYSMTPDSTADWWDSLTTAIADLPVPRGAGERESLTVGRLASETDYYLALRTADEVPNWSELSNIVTASTTPAPDRTPPAAVADLTVHAVSDTSVILSWTAPGDDGDQGSAAAYDLRYASTLLSEDNWEAASQVEDVPDPQAAGSREIREVTRLTAGTTYWFAVKAVDEAMNVSALSNTVAGTPDDTPPAAVSDLRVLAMSDSSITVGWTAPGDDGQEGTANAYDLRYAEESIDTETWETASVVANLAPPGPVGSAETIEVTGLLSRTTYYFVLKTSDKVPNWSDLSNLAIGTTTSPGARLIVVRPDGAGDYATIQGAIDAAADGDVIQLVSGVFKGLGNRNLNYTGKEITIRSEGGDPEACVIDCEGATRGVSFMNGEGPGAILEAVSIVNGLASGAHGQRGDGGGILCEHASPQIIRCIVSNNTADDWGGGIYCGPTGDVASQPVFMECTVSGNYCGNWGGGGACIMSLAPLFERCTFANNWGKGAGGMYCVYTRATFNRCIFRDNAAVDVAGGIWCNADSVTLRECLILTNFCDNESGGAEFSFGSSALVENCTIVLNGAPSGGNISIWSASPRIRNTILAFSADGEAVSANVLFEPLVCCDLFGNMRGDWTGDLAAQRYINNNSSTNPLFCDPEIGDFRLRADSPCALENNPACGQIGAFPVGCGGGRR